MNTASAISAIAALYPQGMIASVNDALQSDDIFRTVSSNIIMPVHWKLYGKFYRLRVNTNVYESLPCYPTKENAVWVSADFVVRE